jgi:hypothetical protein
VRRLLAIAVTTSLGLPVLAAEGPDLRARSIAAASSAARAAEAPALRLGRDPLPEMILAEELERRGPRGNCETSTTDLCYDLRDGRVVYRRAREYMPRFEGLTAESISVRRDRVTFKYSF